MRATVCSFPLFLAACSTMAPTTGSPSDPVAVDAAFSHALAIGSGNREDRASAPGPQIVAVDPVAAALLGAALDAADALRRLHLENIANADTPAWKRRVPDYGSRELRSDGTVVRVPVLLGARAVFAPGALVPSGRPLDVAIDGPGFFAVELAGGALAYTRGGSLQLDAAGQLCSHRGRRLMPPIVLPADTLEIDIDPVGGVSGRTASSPGTAVPFGVLQLHRCACAEALQPLDEEAWLPTEASGAMTTGTPGSAGFGHLQQGACERSNVELAGELIALQSVERGRQAVLAVARQLGFVAP